MSDATIRILILYARFGDGHYQAAKALKERFESQGIREVVLFNLFAESHPVLNRLSQMIYYGSTSHWPTLYGLGYSLSDRLPSSTRWGQWVHSLGSETLGRLVEEWRPSAVIQTFPMLTMSYLRQSMGYRIPTFTLLTDYVFHSRWLHPETDLYFVASEEMKRDMIVQCGVPADQIRVSGIPIRSAFRESEIQAKIGSRMETGSAPAGVLVMAGAYGVSGEVDSMVQSLLAEEGIAISLVCGRNKKLERHMIRLFGEEPRVRIYGYVEAIEQLMADSACLITKAGGITLTEASAMRLPVVVYRPIPGQEEGNASYWTAQGTLSTAYNKKDLRRQTVQYLRQQPFGARAYPSVDGQEASVCVVNAILAYLKSVTTPARVPLRKRRRSKWIRILNRTH
ncbi:MGDG synthase family glycosyltransferase [Cohnella zeiphila]|uniref:Glycosyltransferase n=1 Tax=Cohnella zeiphila TaxID=2761120 RepID=A0A7X0SPR0_9BACL|nr:glycosyltransferase [Cohnella zeiphila]MBB6733736.1 glycosyltransferase [Cohnella zeiphila]